MSASIAKLQAQLDEIQAADNFSSCTECLAHYNNDNRQPKFLPCHHTFCIQCLRNLSGSTVLVTCPVCEKVFVCGDGVDQLPTNHYAVHIAKMTNKWCLTCGKLAKLTCCYENPLHSLVCVGDATFQDAQDLQLLIKEIPLKKNSAIEQRKKVDLQLKTMLKSLKEAEDGIRELISKNDIQLHTALSLDKEFGFMSNKDISIQSLKDKMQKLNAAYKESKAFSRTVLEEFELQRKIRVVINLKNVDGETIPTIPLFEEGFFSNSADGAENFNSLTDVKLMVLSHQIFEILKLGNVSLNVKSPRPLSLASCLSVSDFLVKLKPEIPDQVETESFTLKDPAPLSYSQVVNLRKPEPALTTIEKKLFPLPPASVTHFSLRFYEKRLLGDVAIRACMPAHSKFLQEMALYCSRPREISRKITKASPGIFFTLVVENADLISGITSIQTLHPWTNEEKSNCQWDVGIIPTTGMTGQVDGFKLIFLVEKFNKNNVELSMLLGKVTQGKDLIAALSRRKAQERHGLLITMKSVY